MAGFLERFVAVFIDGIIMGFAQMLLTFPLAIIFESSSSSSFFVGNWAMSSSVGLILSLAYYGYFYTTRGQTLGKMVMKIKVIRADNMQYMDVVQVILRDLLGKFISSLVLSLGYFWYFMSGKRQAWHDSIAGTYAVKTDDTGNILMTGPAEYPKKPLLTFLPLGCMVLVFVLAIFAAIALIAANPAEQLEKAKEASSQREIMEQEGFIFENIEGDPNSPENLEKLENFLKDVNNQ